jgi:cation diffusion facilitator CzcD-associated flavoprotein CzcO
VVGAAFDDDGHLWRLDTADGDVITARFVINAAGALSQPKQPDIDGLDDFQGVFMHTSRWDHGQDLTDKRVAIIGTGASAVQVIPSIAPVVERLTVFQRTPIWCLPKPDRALSGRERWLLQIFPVYGAAGVELDAWWDANRMQAYEGVSVPEFPNLFHIIGPYGFNGASFFVLIETQRSARFDLDDYRFQQPVAA